MSKALDLTTSAHDARWEDAYEELAYTAFALATQANEPAIARMLAAVRGVLADWEHIEGDRRKLRGDAIAARAAVRVADAALDVTLARLAETVLAATDGSPDHDLYRRFFPEPHERVIALGLDGELPSASVAMAQLDDVSDWGGETPETLRAHIDPLRRCLIAGNQALTARADAYASLGRLEARVEAWLETAGAVGRGIHQDLTSLGEQRGLPYRWTASFFVQRSALA